MLFYRRILCTSTCIFLALSCYDSQIINIHPFLHLFLNTLSLESSQPDSPIEIDRFRSHFRHCTSFFQGKPCGKPKGRFFTIMDDIPNKPFIVD